MATLLTDNTAEATEPLKRLKLMQTEISAQSDPRFHKKHLVYCFGSATSDGDIVTSPDVHVQGYSVTARASDTSALTAEALCTVRLPVRQISLSIIRWIIYWSRRFYHSHRRRRIMLYDDGDSVIAGTSDA